MRRAWLLVPIVAAFTACNQGPDWYAPPVQRKPLTGSEPRPFGHFVNMHDPNAELYIVKDVSEALESGAWRWARKRPELRFYLAGVENLNLRVEFTVAESTFKETGPVTFSFFVNGNLLDKVRYPDHGEKRFDKPVPPEMLKAHGVNLVAIEVDKAWTAPTDGAVLGFILTRAGFVQ